MKPGERHVLLLWLLLCSGLTGAIEPISTSIAVGMAATLTAFLASYQNIFYHFHECCRPEWISFNKTALKNDLDRNLFGQHIASRIILKAVNGFMNNPTPKKPLVLSLHGWTGTGKNYMSELIAKNVYKEGMDSSFVHVFTSTLHFPHPSQFPTYKAQLQQWIRGNVSNCERSMFIFDEMDKMHPGLIDSIKPYLDYYDKLDGVSYRKAIFIFLSNAGGDSIAQTALNFWKEGRNREEIELKDLEMVLSLSVFNNKDNLGDELDLKLFGQHIASYSVLKAVEGFMSNENPRKPLVLSLNGATGTGKNYISQLIAESIYNKGSKSRFFHVFSATHHFPHPQEHLQTYKAQLKQWLREGVSDCERSIFVFDEVDKMHPELIDSIKPNLDHYANLDGVSYQKSIFIFLSNAGADVIAQITLDFLKAGKTREEMKLRDLETSLSNSLFKDSKSGFFHSTLIDSNLVDYFVPFLPLEYRHVLQCVNAEMKVRGLLPNQEVADKLAKELMYYPKDEKVFAASGCKTIEKKLQFYL
ncbi:hypothetical protein INR49_022578 [Caranx melampygus]|nr:hypothetical protein INR49_022578 [Caranx melampygus]